MAIKFCIKSADHFHFYFILSEMFSKIILALFLIANVNCIPQEELLSKLTFGLDLGTPFNYEIPQELTTVSILKCIHCFITKNLLQENIALRDNYPFEKYSVKTEDSYILELHRIPFSPKLNNKEVPNKPVAFLMHGLLCSSSFYVIGGPEVSLAYKLSDAGYDVYLGNARGNVYSRKHEFKNPLQPDFWIFDWHEIAVFDVPAMINFALENSNAENLQYIGHSQGGTVHLVLHSLKTNLSQKVKSAHLLAPACYMDNLESPTFKTLSSVIGHPNEYAWQTGFNVLPTPQVLELLGRQLCLQNAEEKSICENIVILITGLYTRNWDQAKISDFVKSLPNGSSFRQILHFVQLVKSKKFQFFDFGSEKNEEIYGSKTPPEYPLKNVNVPTYFYYSKNDILVSPLDIERCAAAMPSSYVKQKYLVPLSSFTHMDFGWANKTVLEENLYSTLFYDLKEAL